MLERLRQFGSRLLGHVWRALKLPPIQGQQPDEDRPIDSHRPNE